MLKIISRLFRVTIILFIGYLLLRGTLNYTGFCWPEKRWLSYAERIDLAIEKVNKNPMIDHLRDELADKYRGAEHKPYTSVEAFKQQNPKCCEVIIVQQPTWGSKLHKVLFGHYAATVRIPYTLRLYNEDGSIEHIPTETYAPITYCGKVHLRP